MTDMAILEASIRDDLNIIAPRTMGVINPIKIIIENYPEGKIETLQAPIHPQNEDMRKRDLCQWLGV
jgi:glutaminyl-tRNA synthetase